MKLKELRLKNKLTQTELAKQLNIPRINYNKYELGINPKIETLILIADFYNVSLDYLLEHKTKNLIDTSLASEKKKELFKIIDNLEEKHCERVIGLIYAYVDQYNQNYNQINNKPNWN